MSRILMLVVGAALVVIGGVIGRLTVQDAAPALSVPRPELGEDRRASIERLEGTIERLQDEVRQFRQSIHALPAGKLSATDPDPVVQALAEIKKSVADIGAQVGVAAATHAPPTLFELLKTKIEPDQSALDDLYSRAKPDDPMYVMKSVTDMGYADAVRAFGRPSARNAVTETATIRYDETWVWKFVDGRRHLWIGFRRGIAIAGDIYDPTR